jgi:hypothetical protein
MVLVFYLRQGNEPPTQHHLAGEDFMTNVLFFAPVVGGVGADLSRVVQSAASESDLEIRRTVKSLSRRLQEPGKDVDIAVLYAATAKHLADLLAVKSLFSGTRIILVLPDRREETIAKGHSLRPRFLTYIDGDLSGVSAVLNKMLGDSWLARNREQRGCG